LSRIYLNEMGRVWKVVLSFSLVIDKFEKHQFSRPKGCKKRGLFPLVIRRCSNLVANYLLESVKSLVDGHIIRCLASDQLRSAALEIKVLLFKARKRDIPQLKLATR
jgi:hypothetical protein